MGPHSYGTGINNLGQVVGNTDIYPFYVGSYAFLYSNGQITNLGTLGGAESGATGINDAVQVTGHSVVCDPYCGEHAFLYSNGQMKDLGAGFGSIGNAINNLGQVTGQAAFGAFLYSNGQIQDLGTLPGTHLSSGHGINNLGQVVGDSDAIPFLYSNGQMYNLYDLIDPALHLTFLLPKAINDQGQIIANYYQSGYLLTPVPEPSTWALFGIALFGLTGAHCLRKLARERRS